MKRPFWNRSPLALPQRPAATQRPNISSALLNRRLEIPGATHFDLDTRIQPSVDLDQVGWGPWRVADGSSNLNNGSLGAYVVAAPVTDPVPVGVERQIGWFGFRIALTSLAADQRLVVVPVIYHSTTGVGVFVQSEKMSLTPVAATSNRGGCGLLGPLTLRENEFPTVYVVDIEDGASNVIQTILNFRYRDRPA